MASQHLIDQFFAFAPFVALLAVLVITYRATRGERATAPGIAGKTYSCAQCGRRGKRDHMLPVTREGAVLWYCQRCAQ